ncbi:MAG: curli-like amyloid fiber formation chaperone CsgH [Pseudomonadota bacterium]
MARLGRLLALLFLLPNLTVAETSVVPSIEVAESDGTIELVGKLTALTAASGVSAMMTVERRSSAGALNSSQGRTLDLAPNESANIARVALNMVDGQRLSARLVVRNDTGIIAQTVLILGGEEL